MSPFSSFSSKISQLSSLSKTMIQVGFSHRLIPSDADFIKLAIKYDLILAATLFSLWIVVLVQTGIPKMVIDYHTFQISKATPRETMRHLAIMMTSVSVNWYFPVNRIIYASIDPTLSSADKTVDIKRIDKEMAMLCGLLALVLLLMNLFGFFGGVLCLLVSPPFFFLVQQFIKRRNVVESRDSIAWSRRFKPHGLVLGLISIVCFFRYYVE